LMPDKVLVRRLVHMPEQASANEVCFSWRCGVEV